MGIMNAQDAEQLARKLLDGQCSVDQFVAELSRPMTADVGLAQVDLDRHRRCGFPEVIFGEGKSVEAIERILTALLDHGVEPLATRVAADKAEHLLKTYPDGRYNPVARTFSIQRQPDDKHPSNQRRGAVTIVTAGTSDLPVAEEARETALWMGAEVDMIQDVGVAGPHRLPAHLDRFDRADAVVVVAGMEGALPSVVGGYVACPVIAVPTSVGYGAAFGGIAALLGMLNSCASNVTVVNIDSGFKGGYVAALVANNAVRDRAPS